MTKRCAILSKRASISPCRNISMSFSFHKKKIRHAILFPKKNLIHGWYSHKIYYSSPNWKNSSFSMSRTYFFVWEWFFNARCVFPQWISRSTLISDRKISNYLECYFDCSIKYILISWVIVSCSNMLNVNIKCEYWIVTRARFSSTTRDNCVRFIPYPFSVLRYELSIIACEENSDQIATNLYLYTHLLCVEVRPNYIIIYSWRRWSWGNA